MSQKPVGRPNKITDDIVSKLENALKHGATVSEACSVSGVSRETFYKRLREDKEFSDKMERARSWLLTIAKHNLADAIRTGDLKASLWLIDRHDNIPEQSISQEEAKDTPRCQVDEQQEAELDHYIESLVQIEVNRRLSYARSTQVNEEPIFDVRQVSRGY